MNATEFITDQQIYEKIILDAIPRAVTFLWLATSDLKDLYVNKGIRMAPFLEVLSDLAESGVRIRLLHAKEPGPAFRADFDKYPGLLRGMERVLCPRVHFKSAIVDGLFAYAGSANLTGAGMGAKGIHKRNFENGIVTREPGLVRSIMEQFDSIWRGTHCEGCRRKNYCADYRQLLGLEF